MIHKILLFILLLSSVHCHAEVLSERGSYLRPYHKGQLDIADSRISSIIKKEMPKGNYSRSKDASWLLLDRATIRFAMGDIEGSINDYAKAIESLDYYGQDIPTEQVKQVLLQDEMGAYQASDHEQVLARVYFALALLMQGDRSNGYALLRSAEEFQQEQRSLYRKLPYTRHFKLPDNPLASYLFANLLEKRGDISNANIIYSQLGLEHSEKNDKATVLVLCHNGNAPYKISATSPASVASAIALEFMLASQNIDPAWSTMVGIPTPTLQQWPWSDPQPTYATINGSRLPLLPLCNVGKNAVEELNQKKPVIVARGVARLLVRRAAVGYMRNQNEWLGLFADIGMLVANANTRADTRSWTTLPAYVDTGRFDLDAGEHTITFEIFNNNTPKQLSYRLQLKPNDLCIINVFNIHPGVTQVLIPQIFQGE